MFRQLWKSASHQTSSLYIDTESDKSQWGWSWLERWMATRPWDQPRVSDKDNIIVATKGENVVIQQHNGMTTENTKPKSLGVDISKPKPDGATKGENVVIQQQNGTTTEHIQPDAIDPLMTTKRKPPAVIARLASPRGPKARDSDEALEVSTARSSARSVYSMGNYTSGGPKFHIQSLKMRKGGTSIATDDESLMGSPSVPNYMSSTQSAKAKARSLSNPKQRPGTPDKEQLFFVAKKRLSCPITEGSMMMSTISQTASSNGH